MAGRNRCHRQLTHDEDIQACDDFRLEAGGLGQLRVQQRRAQVAEQAQLRTDLQQATLRADGRVDCVPLRTANGAEQNRIGSTGTCQGLVGQRYAVTVDGGTAQVIEAQLEAQRVLVVGQVQHLDRLSHDFRANAVTRKNQNLLAHHILDTQ